MTTSFKPPLFLFCESNPGDSLKAFRWGPLSIGENNRFDSVKIMCWWSGKGINGIFSWFFHSQSILPEGISYNIIVPSHFLHTGLHNMYQFTSARGFSKIDRRLTGHPNCIPPPLSSMLLRKWHGWWHGAAWVAMGGMGGMVAWVAWVAWVAMWR